MKLEVGKYYRTAEGDKVGPMLVYGGYDDSFHYESDRDGRLWKVDGTRYYGDSEGTIVAEWAAPATTTFKVGDRVEFTNAVSEYWWFKSGQTGTVAEIKPDGYRYSVKVDESDRPCLAHVNDEHIKPLAIAPTVGDWVKDSEGRIGIVYHDDGDDCGNLKVGYTADGDYEYFCPHELTIVPPGTKQAANDNAPILAEIEELEARISSLRASIA